MIRLLYFAWVRQKVGVEAEDFDAPDTVTNVATLIDALRSQGPGYAQAFGDLNRLRVAVNQTHVDFSAPVKSGDEVAFFPPVTGG